MSINEDVEKIVPSCFASDEVNSFNHCCGKYLGSFMWSKNIEHI